MDTLVAIVFVLVLGLAVAQFFIMSGAFKRRDGRAGGAADGASPALFGGAGAKKTQHDDGNSADSGDSGSDDGGDGGGGGGK